MQITIDTLKKAIAKKGYKWFDDKPNLIGIRTNLQIPDVFNDPFFVAHKDKLISAICTTEPGTTYQKKLLNAKGCWVSMPAQMIDAYAVGLHQGKVDHVCLKSVGKIYGLREDDKDGILFNDKDAIASWQEGSGIGANIHGANKAGITKTVGPWSAGCTVINDWKKKEEIMDFLKTFGAVRFTYTLLEEKDLA